MPACRPAGGPGVTAVAQMTRPPAARASANMAASAAFDWRAAFKAPRHWSHTSSSGKAAHSSLASSAKANQPSAFLAEAAQRQIEFHALIPRHGVVAIVVQQHDGSLHAVRPEDGRILDEARGILPDGSADAALRALILELPRDARAPADAVIGGSI